MPLAALAFVASLAAAQPPTPPPAAPNPGPARAALGRRLAADGDFAAITRAMGEAEVEAMARDTPGLDAAERARLRATGLAVLAEVHARILARVGEAYARHFTLAELRAVVGFLESPAGRAYVGALPQLLPQIAAAVHGVDLGGEIRARFCRETGKLCAAPAH